MNRLLAPSALVLFLAAFGVGCGKSSHVAASAPAHHGPSVVGDGVVELGPDSGEFVDVEAAAPEADFPIARVYGRVTIRAGSVAEVGSRVEGRIESVHVAIGDTVRRGDALVTLSSPDAVTARALARTARTTLGSARAELARVQRMRDDGAASEREVALAERNAAESEIEALRAGESARLLGGGSGRTVVLRSPIDGLVLDLDATIGHLLTGDSDALVHVGDPHDVVVDANVFERDVQSVDVGDKVRIVGGDGTLAQGHVLAVAPNVDTATRTSRVRIAFDEAAANFRPGRFVRVDLLAGEPTIVVPTSAVLVRNGREFAVYVSDAEGGRRYDRRTVVPGPSIDGRVAIASGLAPGDRVVVRGALLLDGSADLLL